MKRHYLSAVAVLAMAGASVAAPLTPTITSQDINFGASFVYSTNGAAPDLLVTNLDGPNSIGQEATAWWPNWPAVAGVVPIWYVFPGNQFVFGGDLQLAVVLTGHDEQPPYLDVSLTGTGAKAGADLEIWGQVGPQPDPSAGNILLWALDIEKVSLYGYGNPAVPPPPTTKAGYVLEGAGTITGGWIAERTGLVGKSGVMRGNIDIDFGPNNPMALVGFPPKYDPLSDVNAVAEGSYSGETGSGFAIPEPATLGLMLAGFGLLIRRK